MWGEVIKDPSAAQLRKWETNHQSVFDDAFDSGDNSFYLRYVTWRGHIYVATAIDNEHNDIIEQLPGFYEDENGKELDQNNEAAWDKRQEEIECGRAVVEDGKLVDTGYVGGVVYTPAQKAIKNTKISPATTMNMTLENPNLFGDNVKRGPMRAEQLVEQLHQEFAKFSEMELTNVPKENFDNEETERAIRQGQIAELDAINTYDQISQSTRNPEVKHLFKDVAEEEKVHQGEFKKAIDSLSPNDESDVAEGEKEAAPTFKELDEALENLSENLEEGFIGNALYRAGQGVSNLARGVRNAGRNFSADVRGVPNKDIDALLAKLGYKGAAGSIPQKAAMDQLIKALYTAIQSGGIADVNAIRTFKTILYGPQGYVTKGIKFNYEQWNPADAKAIADLAPMVNLPSPLGAT